jgi:hypothetical protein
MGDFSDHLFVRSDTHYSLRLTLRLASAFSLLLINDDIPERWEGTFSAGRIRELTTRAGLAKTYSVFVQMLQLALSSSSEELSFDVIAPTDVGVDPAPEDEDERRYFVLVQTTQFDSISYPLPLVRRPFTYEELKIIIRQYRQETIALRAELENAQGRRGSPLVPRDRARTPNPARPSPMVTPGPKRNTRT